jgi:N-acetylated-alpha-linked acidic dipeptidase
MSVQAWLALPVSAVLLVANPATASDTSGASGHAEDASPAASLTAREKLFLDSVSASRIGDYIEELTARPTFPGSSYSPEVAAKTAAMFRAWGWNTRVETYEIPFPRPAERAVELLSAVPIAARLEEPSVPGDPYSEQDDDYLEPYFIYGPDGDVTAPAIYVNFGLRADYAQLERLGQSVAGKIVVIRSGGMWRGGKVELAAEHGAVGVLIYSDPKEDGYFRGDTYPEGGWRSADGVQRGSILYGKYPGDPLTPGVAAVRGAARLDRSDPASTIARIPAMPISYGDAQPILAAMTGAVAPIAWRGSLPITYRSGPTADPVHLKIRYDWKRITIRNIVAELRGTDYAAEKVVRGNHRDGWIFGAHDPHSGHAAMLEEARVLGKFYRDGWRPKRTIVYASWDAEEQGVIGSTEFVEQHLADLTRSAVAYINTDGVSPGALQAYGAASLADFVNQLAQLVKDPQSGVPVAERVTLANRMSLYDAPASGGTGTSAKTAAAVDGEGRILLAAPGYFSDHHSFVSHAGVATLNLGFGGAESNLGAYHTRYDDFAWFKRFGDRDFKYGRASAQINGLAVMRLADAGLLPMDFSATAVSVRSEFAALKALLAQERGEIIRQNELVTADAYRILSDEAQPRVAPSLREVPELDLARLEAGVGAVEAAAARFAVRRSSVNPARLSGTRVAKVNRALIAVERAYLRPDGLPGRRFYRNELFSPGRLWDTVPFPAIGDQLLDGQWGAARAQVEPAVRTLEAIAARIDDAATALD